MKNGPVFFLGLLSAIAISWAGVVLGSHRQIGSLPAYFDEAQGQAFPRRAAGLAARGQLVYADLGCAACHTQQVRRPDFGSDQARGWGERQSVARDYINQASPQLGASRFGPDLANFGARIQKTENAAGTIYNFLYNGSANHPSYRFLFENGPIVGQRSATALTVTGLAAGNQIVPTERAQTLVAHLLSLSTPYDFPESIPVAKPAAAGAAPAKLPVTPVPAAVPDEKKTQETKK